MIKKIVFFVFAIVALISISEFSFYLIFKSRYDWPVIEYYKANMESARAYCFDERLKLIFPRANQMIAYGQPEYLDRFKTTQINGFGFFDDGVNLDKKLFLLVLGDSFTRGVGSGNNLLNGWVEIVERKLNSLDLLNLGNSGTGQVEQIKFYNKIKHYLSHQGVILNFFSGGDFNDNILYFDPSDYIAGLKNVTDKDKYLFNLLRSSNYDIAFEFLAYSPVKSYTVYGILKIYKKFISRFPPFSPLVKVYSDYNKAMSNSFDSLSSGIKKLATPIFIREESSDGKFTYDYDERLYNINYRNIADELAKNSAQIINNFYKDLQVNNKIFFLIIHPSKEEVYLYKSKNNDYDFDYTRKCLKEYLDKDINVFDLTDPLRSYAGHTREPLYYRLDGHYTQKGYQAAAELIYQYLSKNLYSPNIAN